MSKVPAISLRKNQGNAWNNHHSAKWRLVTELLTLVANSSAMPSDIQDAPFDGDSEARMPPRKAVETRTNPQL
jgi:hypothetical protein